MAKYLLLKQHGRFEGAGHVKPAAADPDAFAGVDTVDPEALGGSGAEDSDGFGLGLRP